MTAFRITVLGAGNIGGTLGRKWLAKGHTVVFGVRDPRGERAQALKAEVGSTAQVTTVADALTAGDVVLFAIPGNVVGPTAAEHGATVDGKVVIDATNNVGATTFNSIAAIQAAAPSARVFRAFNTYGWENFADPVYDGVPGDLFYAGPDGEAQTIVEQLIQDIGLRPVRVGGGDQVGLVDDLLRLWFTLASGGRGRNMAFKLLSR
ncbi:MAG TPA: NAD(P)-binding domain-containing protein [Candidatus Dormibacteraeota bacterium]|nr:NAD(P)-binding domain-containing protein [Candidatus Dormibacteraeota bacterium]